MASLIEELITTLSQECEIYQELLPMAREKTQVIVKNDLKSLQEVTEKEQILADRISGMEKKREEIIKNIGIVVSKDPRAINIRTVIQMMEKQPVEKNKLIEIHDTLKRTVQNLAQINNHNKSLIQQSLEMIEFNMNFIQSARTSPGNNSYNKGAAQVDMLSAQPGMFDAKQ
ncbi:flagellar protein FlgN [Anaerocolumna xylanovorans]|uniref:FlgN protein n=1 Tax=Anaerocolumna xylanovorans DSM 12503 TaxID=1121345 RepID=A0A1M7Y833_9FIRM|nr:flagellar protein FlgN [Anaerocolumna xylanovorans]SHO48731.1 FlgN protein [Anaerocolumna xylanovorans DSM 12503]